VRKRVSNAFRSFFGLVRKESRAVASSDETRELLKALEQAAKEEETRLRKKLRGAASKTTRSVRSRVHAKSVKKVGTKSAVVKLKKRVSGTKRVVKKSVRKTGIRKSGRSNKKSSTKRVARRASSGHKPGRR